MIYADRLVLRICARLAEWEFSRPADKRVDQDPSRVGRGRPLA